VKTRTDATRNTSLRELPGVRGTHVAHPRRLHVPLPVAVAGLVHCNAAPVAYKHRVVGLGDVDAHTTQARAL
jgi:hypothetical protein